MEVVTREIRHSEYGKQYKITFLGDIHYGGKDCDVGLLRSSIAKIAEDENHYWVGMGDYCELITHRDPRFDPAELDQGTPIGQLNRLASRQTNEVGEILKPIKSRCLGLVEGNHEAMLELRQGIDSYYPLCDMMQYSTWELALGYSAIIKVRFINETDEGNRSGSHSLKIYVHHGAGGGRKKGAKVNRVQDLAMSFPDCQIYCMGHVHDRIAFIDAALDSKEQKDELKDMPRAFGVTGTYKKTYLQGGRGYGERAQYPPTSLGCITFTIDLHQRNYDIGCYTSTSGLPL